MQPITRTSVLKVIVKLLANLNNNCDLQFDLLYGQRVQVLQAWLLRSMLKIVQDWLCRRSF